MIRLLLSAALLAALADPLQAMTFELSGNELSSQFGPLNEILASGPIEPGDAARFQSFMAQFPHGYHNDPSWTVVLKSPGGDLFEGMRLGEAFREAVVGTRVKAEQTCASACALAFLGGTQAYAVSLGVFREIEPGAHLGYHGFSVGQDQSGLVSETLDQARQANAIIRDYATRMGVKDIGLLLGLFSALEIEEIDTPREVRGLDVFIAGPPLKPRKGWAVHACRHSVAEMLHSLDPVGLEERVPGSLEPMQNLEHFRRSLLDAKFPSDSLMGAHLRPAFLKMKATDAIDVLAGEPVMADRSPIGIWSVWLDRGASFYYDVCFGISDFQSIKTIVVDSVIGRAVTKGYNTLVGFPPDEPLW